MGESCNTTIATHGWDSSIWGGVTLTRSAAFPFQNVLSHHETAKNPLLPIATANSKTIEKFATSLLRFDAMRYGSMRCDAGEKTW
jgi:hypothetical protein